MIIDTRYGLWIIPILARPAGKVEAACSPILILPGLLQISIQFCSIIHTTRLMCHNFLMFGLRRGKMIFLLIMFSAYVVRAALAIMMDVVAVKTVLLGAWVMKKMIGIVFPILFIQM
jgi:hypothetical protein